MLRLLKLFVTIAFAGITTFLFSLVIPINIVVINGVISLAVGVVIYGVTYATWSTAAMEANIKELERAQIVISANVATEIWQAPDEIKETVPPAEETAEEVAAPSSRSIHHIKNEEYPILVDKLEGLLDKGIYINSDLTLSQLSEKLGIPSYQTSELINRYYRGSFFDFINSSRIEEVKKRLTDPALLHFSILGIAMDCGFNSKSSFNTAFKKYTGMTPSEYRKKNIGSKVRLSKS
ncbi:MAG TPA: helix-turn-helix transcriptional regulator [Segetibacter sp.]|nr:helix-turn-helix transcriptional regulator [Segetibacter sp.]